MINLLLNILSYQNNETKLRCIFSNMCYIVYYHLLKFQLKTPPMYGEIKNQIVLRGNLNQRI